MKQFLLILSLFFAVQATAQIESGLRAWYSFDNGGCNPLDQTGVNANNGIFAGDTIYLPCACGPVLDAMPFDGSEAYYFSIASSSIDDIFNTDDFSIAFYFKSINTRNVQNQTILSKRSDECSNFNSFDISYDPTAGFLDILFSQDAGIQANMSYFLDLSLTWQHVILTRKGNTVKLYINSEFVQERITAETVDLTNDRVLTVGKSDCSSEDNNFEGILDDLRFYKRALTLDDIRELYVRPNQVSNASYSADTLIFKGSTFRATIPNTCATAFSWTTLDDPSTEVANEQEPLLAPETTTTYLVAMRDDFDCIGYDTLHVDVIDPDTLDCTKVFLPDAFTPNYDGLNDTYGISNPFVIDELISFEIFNRWGERLFFTDSAFDRWDGSYKNKEQNSGIYLYKVNFKCDAIEQQQNGSLMIMR